MGLIDTHTHLEGFARRGELPAVLARAREAGVEAMIAIGTDTDDWDLYRDLVRADPSLLRYSVGLHPCSVDASWKERVCRIEAYWTGEGPGPVALGECGLDRFHLPKEPEAAQALFSLQQGAFEAQLALAVRLGCPVVVHSRGAFDETVALIDASGIDWSRIIFHCFSEGPDQMEVLKGRGGWGSFTGILTYKSAESIRAAARLQGVDRFMAETDAPYLTPVPHRGKPNEPAFVAHTVRFAAESVFGVSVEVLTQKSRECSRRVFGL